MYLKKCLVVATLLLAIGGYAQNTKLVLAKGKKYEVTSTTKANTTLTLMGQEMETTADNLTVQSYEVKDARAAETDLVTTITRLVINTSIMGQDSHFDSDKKDNSGPGTDEMNKMVGKSKNITINTSGKILKEDKDEASAALSMMGMGAGGSNITLFREVLIGRNLAAGASWPDSVTVTTDKIKTTTAGIYTVKSIENNIAIITFTGTTSVSGTMEQQGQEMEMKSTSKVTGESKVDITTGIINESSSTSDGSMTIEAGGMTIPATVKTTTNSKTKAL